MKFVYITQQILSVLLVYNLNMHNFKITGKDFQPPVSVQEKAHQSFNLLYDTYAPALFGFISGIISNKKEAEEILINTFMKIWSRMGDFNSTDSGLFNQMLNIGRQTALDTINNKEERGFNINYKINAATYNDKEDTVFDLIYYKGYTISEAASALHISNENVRILLKTSIRNLHKKNKVV